jgi:hypothetical protein
MTKGGWVRSVYVVVVEADEEVLGGALPEGDYRMVLHRVLAGTGRIAVVAIAGESRPSRPSTDGAGWRLSDRFAALAERPALRRYLSHAISFEDTPTAAQLEWLTSLLTTEVSSPPAASSLRPDLDNHSNLRSNNDPERRPALPRDQSPGEYISVQESVNAVNRPLPPPPNGVDIMSQIDAARAALQGQGTSPSKPLGSDRSVPPPPVIADLQAEGGSIPSPQSGESFSGSYTQQLLGSAHKSQARMPFESPRTPREPPPPADDPWKVLERMRKEHEAQRSSSVAPQVEDLRERARLVSEKAEAERKEIMEKLRGMEEENRAREADRLAEEMRADAERAAAKARDEGLRRAKEKHAELEHERLRQRDEQEARRRREQVVTIAEEEDEPATADQGEQKDMEERAPVVIHGDATLKDQIEVTMDACENNEWDVEELKSPSLLSSLSAARDMHDSSQSPSKSSEGTSQSTSTLTEVVNPRDSRNKDPRLRSEEEKEAAREKSALEAAVSTILRVASPGVFIFLKRSKSLPIINPLVF